MLSISLALSLEKMLLQTQTLKMQVMVSCFLLSVLA
jgi:hypothetical protein